MVTDARRMLYHYATRGTMLADFIFLVPWNVLIIGALGDKVSYQQQLMIAYVGFLRLVSQRACQLVAGRTCGQFVSGGHPQRPEHGGWRSVLRCRGARTAWPASSWTSSTAWCCRSWGSCCCATTWCVRASVHGGPAPASRGKDQAPAQAWANARMRVEVPAQP